jgi:hypothetical protein
MEMADEFKYQVFISYSSHDREWARKMEADLRRKWRIERIFRDERNLEAGTPWAPDLIRAVQSSRHLLLLWSKAAAESQWVNHEMAAFDVDTARSGHQPTANRRILCVLLEGESKVLASLQDYKVLRDLKAYETGIDRFNDEQSAAWDSVVDDLARIIFDTEAVTAISLALLAMTRPEADALDLHETIDDRVKPLAEQLTALGFPDLEALKACYGPARKDWRPFGGRVSLGEVLAELLGVINGLISEKKFRFQEIEFVNVAFDLARAELTKGNNDLDSPQLPW